MTRSEFLSGMEDVLGVSPGALRESDSRDTIEGWSSLEDLKIMTIISSECGLNADGELLELETVGELLDALEQRRAFSG